MNIKVAPAELENHIRGLDGVTDVAVIGVADAKKGEAPRAYVVKGWEELTEEDVKVAKDFEIRNLKSLLWMCGLEFAIFFWTFPQAVTYSLSLRATLLELSRHTSIWPVASSSLLRFPSLQLARSSGRISRPLMSRITRELE